jgi:hypothetical protein
VVDVVLQEAERAVRVDAARGLDPLDELLVESELVRAVEA